MSLSAIASEPNSEVNPWILIEIVTSSIFSSSLLEGGGLLNMLFVGCVSS